MQDNELEKAFAGGYYPDKYNGWTGQEFSPQKLPADLKWKGFKDDDLDGNVDEDGYKEGVMNDEELERIE